MSFLRRKRQLGAARAGYFFFLGDGGSGDSGSLLCVAAAASLLYFGLRRAGFGLGPAFTFFRAVAFRFAMVFSVGFWLLPFPGRAVPGWAFCFAFAGAARPSVPVHEGKLRSSLKRSSSFLRILRLIWSVARRAAGLVLAIRRAGNPVRPNSHWFVLFALFINVYLSDTRPLLRTAGF
jgi:hypothetical protein